MLVYYKCPFALVTIRLLLNVNLFIETILEVRYPCVAYITVMSVNFEDLSANVDVLRVQHEAVSLPESIVSVPLIELWPTIKQREQCVNAASTAEFIDLMR